MLHQTPPDSLAACKAGQWVPLRVPAMRRLCWRLGLATKQTRGQRLDWSAWRRWPQEIAQDYHYRRRAGPEVQL